MNINSDYFKIGATAIVTSIIFSVFILISRESSNLEVILKNNPNLQQISKDLAHDMLYFYKTERNDKIGQHMPIEQHIKHDAGQVAQDTKCMWLSKAEIQGLYSTITSNEDGIRIYFGVYPVLDKTGDVPPGSVYGKDDYRNLQTLVFVPTHDSSGFHPDDIFTAEGEKRLIMITIKQSSIQNHGGICPPPTSGCTGADLAA